MGTITINIDNETEMKFREVASKEKGVGKGKLGLAVKEAFDLWIKNKERDEISQRQISLMNEGFRLGKYSFNREELHERKR